MPAPLFTLAHATRAAHAARVAGLGALLGLAGACTAQAQGAEPAGGDAALMARAVREARAYQRADDRAAQASQQPALLTPLEPSTPQMRISAGVALRFTAQAPARFAGRRLALEGMGSRQCYTDAPLSQATECRSVTPAAMNRIVQGQQWYARSLAVADEQRRSHKARSAQSDAPCQAWMAALPPDYAVWHIDQPARLTAGRQLHGVQLKGDDSGGGVVHHARLRVNQPGKPVVLLLTNYYPTIWEIAHSPQTRIAAVWASGYHRPYPIGVEADVPVLTTSYDEPRCKNLPAQALPRIHRPEQPLRMDGRGELLIGQPAAQWVSHGHIDSLKKGHDEPLSGTAGMQQLRQRGAVRPVVESEYAELRAQRGQAAQVSNQPQRPMRGHYRILRAMRLPSGMYGGYSAVFHLPDDVPFPEGDMGHNRLYLLSSGYCLGACG